MSLLESNLCPRAQYVCIVGTGPQFAARTKLNFPVSASIIGSADMNRNALIVVGNLKTKKGQQDQLRIDALLQRDPDESLWDRLYWQFKLSPLLRAEMAEAVASASSLIEPQE